MAIDILSIVIAINTMQTTLAGTEGSVQESRCFWSINDRAVMATHGFHKDMTESKCVAELFRMYQALVAGRQ